MTLADEVGTLVHAFDDKGRKDSVRALAARVAELEARLLRPELPPYTHEGSGLPRYGLQWPTPNRVLSVPMSDGYWTPFHLAEAAVAAEREAIALWLEGAHRRDGHNCNTRPHPTGTTTAQFGCGNCGRADAIRARGGQT